MNWRLPRTTEWILISLGLLGVIAQFRPQDVMVLVWKLLMAVIAAIVAHRVYQKMDEHPTLGPRVDDGGVSLSLAIIVAAFVIGVTLGL